MATCAEREYDKEEFTVEKVVKECFRCHEESSEECREDTKECQETNATEIESHLRANGFLRTTDSDEESFAETDNKIRTNSDEKPSSDTQTNDKICETKDEVVVSVNSTGDSFSKTDLKPQRKSWRDGRRPRSSRAGNKWGESVGITDSKGRPKRLVNLTDVKNYIPLKMRFRSEFKFYFSLIDSRYPQRFKSYGSDKQRWRMRYNVFVDGVFDTSKKYESLLHVGEIMIYFDIAKNMSHPYYANCSFYANYTPPERNVDTTKLTRLIFRLHDVLTSSLMLQLKFPVDANAFKHTDHLYYKFLGRQKELMDELHFIQNRWAASSKWLSIETKSNKIDERIAFRQLSIERRPNKKSEDRRRRRSRNRSPNPEERRRSSNGRSNADNGLMPSRSDEQHKKRTEDRVDRRYVNNSDNRRSNPSNRRKSDQTFGTNPLRETASNYNQKWAEDRNPSQKTSQRRNRNTERVDTFEDEVSRAFRGGRREERRSRPKTRRR